MTILTPFAAKFLSLSRLMAGFVCVSSMMRPTLVLEFFFEKYAFTSLIATFRAAAWDSPRDDNAPLNGSRAPNVIVCFPSFGGIITSEFVLTNSDFSGEEGNTRIPISIITVNEATAILIVGAILFRLLLSVPFSIIVGGAALVSTSFLCRESVCGISNLIYQSNPPAMTRK